MVRVATQLRRSAERPDPSTAARDLSCPARSPTTPDARTPIAFRGGSARETDNIRVTTRPPCLEALGFRVEIRKGLALAGPRAVGREVCHARESPVGGIRLGSG